MSITDPYASPIICSGARPGGLDPLFVKRIQRDTWRPSESLPTGCVYADLFGPEKRQRSRAKDTSYDGICPECGAHFHVEHCVGGHRTYCSDACSAAVRRRLKREWQANSEARKREET